MGFKKVSGAKKYFKYKECSPGDVLVKEGTYMGAEQGKYGIQHVFKTGEVQVVLNSAGHLNYLLESFATLGQRCNVIYKEKVLLTSGAMKGKEAHNFELEVDDGTDAMVTIASPSPASYAEPASSLDDDIVLA